MDARYVAANLQHLNHLGVVMSPEERACLQSGLDVLHYKESFQKTILWGVITCLEGKYYIAQGYQSNPVGDRTCLYSKDGMQWGRMPHASEEVLQKARTVRGRFTGDPSFVQEYTIRRQVVQAPGEDTSQGRAVRKEVITLKEEDRLAATVVLIDREAAITPRGYYMQKPTGEIVVNRMFSGLPLNEAVKLRNYLHSTMDRKVPTQRPPPNNVKGIDIMQSIEGDGWWSVKQYRGSSITTLSSMLWEGYHFYMIPNSTMFGGLYYGFGEKNYDVIHMMSYAGKSVVTEPELK